MENVSACNLAKSWSHLFICECCIENAEYELKMGNTRVFNFLFLYRTDFFFVVFKNECMFSMENITHRCSRIEDGWLICIVSSKKVVKLFMLKWLSKELIAQTLYVCIYCCTCIPVCDNTFEFFREKKLENYHVLNDVYPFLSINYYFFTVT